VLGPLSAAAVLIADAGKGFFAVLALPGLFGLESGIPAFLLARVAAAASCVVGHVFPVWLGFRGGKGVAVGAAVATALAPAAALICLAVFLTAAAVSRYVSLASLLAAATLPAAYAALYRADRFDAPVFALFLAAAGLVFYAHRGNIARLRRGEEPKLGRRAQPNRR
jgi:glycerol-3-phosphate acyltransferase PlsY